MAWYKCENYAGMGLNPVASIKANTGVNDVNGVKQCSLELEKGTYIISMMIVGTIANGTHMGSITLNVGELVQTVNHTSVTQNNVILEGVCIERVYYVELTEPTTVIAKRNYIASQAKDYIGISAVKLR